MNFEKFNQTKAYSDMNDSIAKEGLDPSYCGSDTIINTKMLRQNLLIKVLWGLQEQLKKRLV